MVTEADTVPTLCALSLALRLRFLCCSYRAQRSHDGCNWQRYDAQADIEFKASCPPRN